MKGGTSDRLRTRAGSGWGCLVLFCPTPTPPAWAGTRNAIAKRYAAKRYAATAASIVAMGTRMSRAGFGLLK